METTPAAAPPLRLVPMTDEEYAPRRAAMIEAHAQGVAAAGGLPVDETRQASERQSDELLPQGVQTPDMLLFLGMVAEQSVGWLWIGLPRTPDRPEMAWIYYVAVDPGHRAKGYGRALLLAAERELTRRGVPRLGLNVYGHNTVAIGLYQSLGFEVTAQQMAKPLPEA
ncbi:GNAT family N-acetyltransferase [Plantactinospora soyae]|uniref:Ribosomal protein S18 acetylase RimI-like enzyme n=1 Tax=Plantactinospora soyae TaxID=1544732 RepID=A0A927QXK0_9ACTN|nr:GNAT family N-acetyltransferase [Plantactinospora soyae]MBE1488145.1 ribosomal protein S18 acetylase RimI-like enzyme [Plantactinospora soyae]